MAAAFLEACPWWGSNMNIGRPIGGTSEANIMVAAEHVATPERLKIRKSQLIVWTMYGLIGTAAPCDVSTSYSPMAMGGPMCIHRYASEYLKNLSNFTTHMIQLSI
jgi:hypothetical protein